jgi:hypothetical protein
MAAGSDPRANATPMAVPSLQNLSKSAGDLFTVSCDNEWSAIVQSMNKFLSLHAGQRGNIIST